MRAHANSLAHQTHNGGAQQPDAQFAQARTAAAGNGSGDHTPACARSNRGGPDGSTFGTAAAASAARRRTSSRRKLDSPASVGSGGNATRMGAASAEAGPLAPLAASAARSATPADPAGPTAAGAPGAVCTCAKRASCAAADAPAEGGARGTSTGGPPMMGQSARASSMPPPPPPPSAGDAIRRDTPRAPAAARASSGARRGTEAGAARLDSCTFSCATRPHTTSEAEHTDPPSGCT